MRVTILMILLIAVACGKEKKSTNKDKSIEIVNEYRLYDGNMNLPLPAGARSVRR